MTKDAIFVILAIGTPFSRTHEKYGTPFVYGTNFHHIFDRSFYMRCDGFELRGTESFLPIL